MRAQTPMLSGTISESHLLRLNAMVTMMKCSPAFRRNYQVFLKKCLVFRWNIHVFAEKTQFSLFCGNKMVISGNKKRIRLYMLHINYLQHIFNIYGQKHAFCLDFCIFAPAIERTVFLCQQSVINDDHKMCRKRLPGEL